MTRWRRRDASSGLMDRILRALLALITAVALSLPTAVVARDVPVPSPPADGELAFVTDVIDGDTIRVDREGGALLVRTGPGQPLSAIAVGDVVRCAVDDTTSPV